MQLAGVVTNIQTRPVPIKKGPRAGSVGTTYTVTVDGKEIDCGFKCAVKTGDLVLWEITDIPNKWGKYEMVKKGGSESAISDAFVGGNGAAAGPNVSNVRNEFKSNRSGFPIPKSDHATSICRQNALTNAVNFHKYQLETGMVTDINTVLETAATFARWTTGQLEQEEAERILRSSTHEPNA